MLYRPLAVGVVNFALALWPPYWCTSNEMASGSTSNGNKKKLLLGGYFSLLKDETARKRYKEKLELIEHLDPYEMDRKEWEDNVDLWPSVTHIHVGMFLLLTPSVYSGDDLMNYKSMESYRSFLSGWVREILVKIVTNLDGSKKVIMIAKVMNYQL